MVAGVVVAVVAEVGVAVDTVVEAESKSGDGSWDSDDEREQIRPNCKVQLEAPKVSVQLMGLRLSDNDDEDVARAVSNGEVPSYSLEAQLGDPLRGAAIRRRAVELSSGSQALFFSMAMSSQFQWLLLKDVWLPAPIAVARPSISLVVLQAYCCKTA